MKRNRSDSGSSEGSEKRSWYQAASSTSSNVSQSNDSALPKGLDTSKQNDPPVSTAPTLTTTFAPSMPLYGLYGNNSAQNAYPMPFPGNFNNRMFSLSNCDPSLPINASGMPFVSGDEAAASTSQGLNSMNNLSSAAADPLQAVPATLPKFSVEEAEKVCELMKDKKEGLKEAVKIVIGWLERGDCSKSNNNQFMDLINLSHNIVWTMMREKTDTKEKLYEERRECCKEMSNISSQFNEIIHVFDTVKVQKIWDHFTKAQRKQMSSWIDEAKNLKSQFSDEADDYEEDGDVTSNGCNGNKPRSPDSSTGKETVELEEENQKLKEELDKLQNQLRTAEDNMEGVRKVEDKTVIEYKSKITDNMSRMNELESHVAMLRQFKADAILSKKASENKETTYLSQFKQNNRIQVDKTRDPEDVQLDDDEIHLVTLVSVFLYVHPFGASIDYICSYLAQVYPRANDTRYVESVIRKFPKVFKEKTSGIGATLTKNWILLGFNDNKNK